MPSDLQVSNIKDLTGSNTGLTIASDGQITVNQNNPTLTLGSNTTFPTGSLVKSTFIKISSGSVPSTTTTFASTFDYQQVTCTVGNTIVFDFSFGGEVEINSGSSAQRQANFKFFQSTSSVSSGATSSLGTQLNLQTSGRTLTGTNSAGAATFYYLTCRSIFVATATSHYFGMAHASPDTTAVRATVFATSDRPATISVFEFKGDVLT